MLQGWVWRLMGAGAGRAKRGKRGGQADAASGEEEAGRGEDEPAPWVVVLTVYDPVGAAIAAARLGDEGIPVRTRQEAASSVLPVGLGILGRIDLLVPEPRAEEALVILEDVGALDADDEPLDDSPLD
jgi:hypothetical protein